MAEGQAKTDREAPKEIAYVLDVAKLSLEEEFHTAEGVGAKSRQLFTVCIGFFTIVQTVAFTAYEKDNVNNTEDTWLFVLAAVALVGLTAVAYSAARADSLVPSYQVSTDIIEDLIAGIYPDQATPVVPAAAAGITGAKQSSSKSAPAGGARPPLWRRALGLASHARPATAAAPQGLDRYSAPGWQAAYIASLVRRRRRENDQRRHRYRWVRLFGVISIALTAVELMAALYYRLP